MFQEVMSCLEQLSSSIAGRNRMDILKNLTHVSETMLDLVKSQWRLVEVKKMEVRSIIENREIQSQLEYLFASVEPDWL